MTLKLFVFTMMIAIISGLTFVEHLQTAEQLAQAELQRHNYYRNLHRAPPLILDRYLQNIAQIYTNQLARSGKFAHSGRKGFGENIYMISGGRYLAQKATDSWYNQIRFYNFNNPQLSLKSDQFTQVVWRGTTRVGFGYAVNFDKTYVVANYSPPGNVQGQYRTNVFPKS